MLYDKIHLSPLPADAPGPVYVVMDLQGVEPLFKKRVGAMKQCDGCLTEVLELLPSYINERQSASDGLEAFLERIVEDHEEADCRMDGMILASATRMVGEHLIDQFKSLKMYHDDGLCHYLFDRWLDRQSPVFMKVRTEDLFYSPFPNASK